MKYEELKALTDEYNKCCSKYGALPCEPQVIGTALRHNPNWVNLKKNQINEK